MTRYMCWEEGDTEEDSFVIEADDPQEAAEIAAEEDFDHRDGWERRDDDVTWYVQAPNGKTFRFKVYRMLQPYFYATPATLEDE